MRTTAVAGAWKLTARRRRAVLQMRRRKLARSREARARFARVLIVSVLFVTVIGAGWAIRTPTVTPAAQSHGESQSDGKLASTARPGKVVQEVPDGRSCRTLPFDNLVGWVGFYRDGMCEDVARKRQLEVPRKFTWGRSGQPADAETQR